MRADPALEHGIVVAAREEVLVAEGNQSVTSISPDGDLLVYTNNSGAATGMDVWAMPIAPDAEPFPLVETPGTDFSGALSPDGRWLVHADEPVRDRCSKYSVPHRAEQPKCGAGHASLEAGSPR